MEYTFNAYYTLIAGTFVLLLGRLLVYKIPFLRNYNIPEPVAGEEFVLILPGTDTASANKTLEKLRLVVANHEWLLRQLTVSIGLASADLFDDKKQLLEVADQMLYKAKTQGRNQTSVFATL